MDRTGGGRQPALRERERVAVSTVMSLEDDLECSPPHNPGAWWVDVSDAWVSH